MVGDFVMLHCKGCEAGARYAREPRGEFLAHVRLFIRAHDACGRASAGTNGGQEARTSS